MTRKLTPTIILLIVGAVVTVILGVVLWYLSTMFSLRLNERLAYTFLLFFILCY